MSEAPPSDRAATGKIAQLTYELREGICLRLRNGWTGSRIRAWLESSGITGVSDQNISNWRHSARGYQSWLAEQTRLDQIRDQADSVRRELEAGGGRIHDRLAIDFAQSLVTLRESAGGDPAAISELAKAAANIIKAATARDRTDLARSQFNLSREKFERETCTLFLKWYTDERARRIADSSATNDDKIKALRAAYFADVDALEQSGEVKLPA